VRSSKVDALAEFLSVGEGRARARFGPGLTHKRSFSHLHFDPKPDPQSGH
jgi:hypothetical protein